MTNIQFYVGQGSDLKSRLLLACKLTQKAVDYKLHVYIHADSEDTAEKLDRLLWEWNDVSFIPHAMAPDNSVLVELGYDFEPIERCDYLINLSNNLPPFFGRFERMAEILDQNAEILDKGRERYRFYKDRGYSLHYHKL